MADQAMFSTYGELMREAAARDPAGEALVFPDRRVSYAALLEQAGWRARELQALGVCRGDRFGVLMPNSPNIIEFLIGGALMGAVMVPINTRFKVRELRHVITDAELTTVITTAEIDEHVNFRYLLHEALPSLGMATDPFALSLAEAPELKSLALVSPEDHNGFAGGEDASAAG